MNTLLRLRGGDALFVRYQPKTLKQGGSVMSKRNLIENIQDNYGLTIRAICTTADLKYYKVHNASKKPVVGAVYDPDAINWDAIASVLTKEDIQKLEKVDWEQVSTGKKTKVEYDYDAFKVGTRWHLRNFGWITVVYTTNTHIVLVLDDNPEVPRAWKLETFLVNGPSEEERYNK